MPKFIFKSFYFRRPRRIAINKLRVNLNEQISAEIKQEFSLVKYFYRILNRIRIRITSNINLAISTPTLIWSLEQDSSIELLELTEPISLMNNFSFFNWSTSCYSQILCWNFVCRIGSWNSQLLISKFHLTQALMIK